MKLPEDANDEKKQAPPDMDEACIKNPYYSKELLTRAEALDAINLISSMLVIDGTIRSQDSSK